MKLVRDVMAVERLWQSENDPSFLAKIALIYRKGIYMIIIRGTLPIFSAAAKFHVDLH